MSTENTAAYYLERLTEAFRYPEPETELGRAVERMRQPFQIGDGKKWSYGGFIAAFSALFDALRAIDDSIPPGLPPHLLDPAGIAKTFGLRLDDFDWTGVRGVGGIEEKLKQIEAKVDSGRAKQIDGPTSPDYISIEQAAKTTGLSQSHLRRAVRSGELTASNVGTPRRSMWRIAREDLAAWMERKKGGTPHPPRAELKELVERHLPGLF